MIMAMITFRQIWMSNAFYGKVYGKTGHSEPMIFILLKVTDPLENLLQVTYSRLRKTYTRLFFFQSQRLKFILGLQLVIPNFKDESVSWIFYIYFPLASMCFFHRKHLVFNFVPFIFSIILILKSNCFYITKVIHATAENTDEKNF